MMISWEVGKFCKEAEFLEFSCKEQRMVIFTFTCTEHISLSKYYQIFFRCIFFTLATFCMFLSSLLYTCMN